MHFQLDKCVKWRQGLLDIQEYILTKSHNYKTLQNITVRIIAQCFVEEFYQYWRTDIVYVHNKNESRVHLRNIAAQTT